ncbi:MAG: tRNA (adenosine(37)-N6)-threonylcarbamoyltransferase complex ATPase subunit type 1 TsaE [Rhodothermales bacterium]|nr:tRNA (adenosine(37)-N6)-threonylcarbamoyltransferase complex ATPase subunit type 1 TsaE [Rhodothermales bacterium]
MADLSRIDDLLPVETESPEATVTLGRKIATALERGDVVALVGDLGTGKTHLVSGVAAACGAGPGDVTSPTFTIAHEYASNPPVYHLDLYRLSGPEDVLSSGAAEYLDRDGICLVEWPERAGRLLPLDTVVLRLTHAGGDRRRIERPAMEDAQGE